MSKLKAYTIAIGENNVQSIIVEARTEQEAIDEALRISDFAEPYYIDTDNIEKA